MIFHLELGPHTVGSWTILLYSNYDRYTMKEKSPRIIHRDQFNLGSNLNLKKVSNLFTFCLSLHDTIVTSFMNYLWTVF